DERGFDAIGGGAAGGAKGVGRETKKPLVELIDRRGDVRLPEVGFVGVNGFGHGRGAGCERRPVVPRKGVCRWLGRQLWAGWCRSPWAGMPTVLIRRGFPRRGRAFARNRRCRGGGRPSGRGRRG